MKPNLLFITLLNVLGWGFITYSDFLEETKSNDLFFPIAVFVMPVMLFCIYMFVEKRWLRTYASKLKNHITFVVAWIIENILIYRVWDYLFLKNKWIVEQDFNGWDNMLNGIEYVMYFLFSIGVCSGLLLLGDLVVFIWKKVGGRKTLE